MLIAATACSGPSVRDTDAADHAAAEAAEPAALPPGIRSAREAAAVGEYALALELYLEALDAGASAREAERAARLAAALGDWDALARAAGAWRALEPDSTPARQLSVIAELRGGDVEAAVDLLAEAIESAGSGGRAWLEAVALLGTSETPDRSRRALDALLERAGAGTPGFGHLQRSRLEWQLGQGDRALEHAEAALEADPSFERAAWAGNLAQALGQPERALSYYRQAREIAPDRTEAALSESEVLLQVGRPAEALAALDGLPDRTEILYARASLQRELDRLGDARATWQRLARLDDEQRSPRHAWLTALLAESLGLDEQALDWYRRVDAEHSDRAEFRRAAILARLGRVERARTLLESLRARPDPEISEQAWLLDAQIVSESQGPEAATTLLTEAVRRTPGSIDLLYGRAMAAADADNMSLAEQDLRAILQRDPDNAAALNALGYLLSDRTDRQREALRLIERALELDPDNPAVLDSMGWVLHKLGRDEQALPYLRRAAEGQFHSEIVLHLIEVLWRLGRRDEAEAWIERAERELPADSGLDALLERLGEGG